MNRTQLKQSNKIFYGWWIVAVCFFVLFFTLGVAVTAFSATSAFLVEEWGIAQTQITSMVTVRTFSSVIAMYLCGFYYAKINLRLGFSLGTLMGTVGYALFAIANGNVAIGYIAMIVIGACRGFGGMYAISLLMEKWFFKRKAVAIAIITTSSGFTTMIMPKILVYFVNNYSLNASFWFTAAMFAVAAALILLVIKSTPEEMGLIRYGEGQEADAAKRVVTEKYEAEFKHCVYLMVAVFCIGGICYVQGQIRTLNLTTAGWTAAEAAQSLSKYGLLIILGKLVYGPISDRYSQRQISWLWYLLIAVSHAIYALAPTSFFSPVMAWISHLLYALGGPICTVGLALYGIEIAYKGDTVKWIRNYLVIYNVGSLLLTPLAGISADLTGNYSLCFWVLAVMSIVALVFAQMAYSGAYKNYNKLHGNQK